MEDNLRVEQFRVHEFLVCTLFMTTKGQFISKSPFGVLPYQPKKPMNLL